MGTRRNGVPRPFCTIVTLHEDLYFSFQFLCVADVENERSFFRVRASEKYSRWCQSSGLISIRGVVGWERFF